MKPLQAFSVLGESELIEDGQPDEYGELPHTEGDERRTLHRYADDQSYTPVNARVNADLFESAASAKVAIVTLYNFDQNRSGLLVSSHRGGVSPDWVMQGLDFNWGVPDLLKHSDQHACFLADKFDSKREQRTLYYACYNVDSFTASVVSRAKAMGFSVSVNQADFHEIAPQITPLEYLETSEFIENGSRNILVGFSFTGHPNSLSKLRWKLQRRGYNVDELLYELGQMRVRALVTTTKADIHETLREVVTTSRLAACSYVGEETLEGREQFYLSNPIPKKYAATSSNHEPNFVRTVTNRLGSFFGRQSV